MKHPYALLTVEHLPYCDLGIAASLSSSITLCSPGTTSLT